VLLEDDGVALRGLFIIDRNGIMRQSTINDLPVGRDVQEVKRLVTVKTHLLLLFSLLESS